MISSKRAWLAGALLLLVGGTTATAAGATGSPRQNSASVAPRAISAANCAANRAAGPITWVSPFSFDASVSILDVFAAQSLGYFKAECLDVQFVTNSYASNQLVSAGTGTITSVGSAADALNDIADGGNFVGIATFADTSDYAILTRPSITKLTQLQGKVLGYHAPLPVVLTEMLKAAGVKTSQVRMVNDTSYDPTLLIHGPYLGLQAYQSNEPLTLRADHDKFNEFVPSEFGVAGTFNTIVVNRSFLAAHEAATADFLRAELHAYNYCTAHMAACISIEAAASKAGGEVYDVPHSLAEWKFETGLVRAHTLPGKGIGVETTAEWAPELAALIANKLVKRGVITSTAENTRLAASLYRGTTLIWPGN